MKVKNTLFSLSIVAGVFFLPGLSEALDMKVCKTKLTRFNDVYKRTVAMEKKLHDGTVSQGTHTQGGHTPADYVESSEMKKYKQDVTLLNTLLPDLKTCEQKVKGFKIMPPLKHERFNTLEVQYTR